MEQGVLAIVILCMFGFGFYIVNKVDQFLDKIQENAKDKPKEEQYSLKILFPDDLSDEELLRENSILQFLRIRVLQRIINYLCWENTEPFRSAFAYSLFVMKRLVKR